MPIISVRFVGLERSGLAGALTGRLEDVSSALLVESASKRLSSLVSDASPDQPDRFSVCHASRNLSVPPDSQRLTF